MTSPKGCKPSARQLEYSETYRVKNTEKIVGGTGLLKQGLIRLLVEKAREVAKKEYAYLKDFASLQSPAEQWCHGQYRCMATILDVSTNTVKRMFNCNGYLNEQQNLSPHTCWKIQTFLQTDDWEREALHYILKKGLTK